MSGWDLSGECLVCDPAGAYLFLPLRGARGYASSSRRFRNAKLQSLRASSRARSAASPSSQPPSGSATRT
eukprot:11479639-Alexandrium_andersonii.AAC.1